MQPMSDLAAENFVELLYKLILACEPDDIYNLGDKRLEKLKIAVENFKSIPSDEKIIFEETLKELLHLTKSDST